MRNDITWIYQKSSDKFTCLTTALSPVCYRLAWPHRPENYIMYFGHGKSWLSTMFNYTCVHIAGDFRKSCAGTITTSLQANCQDAARKYRNEENHQVLYGALLMEHINKHAGQELKLSIKRNSIRDINTCICSFHS